MSRLQAVFAGSQLDWISQLAAFSIQINRIKEFNRPTSLERAIPEDVFDAFFSYHDQSDKFSYIFSKTETCPNKIKNDYNSLYDRYLKKLPVCIPNNLF